MTKHISTKKFLQRKWLYFQREIMGNLFSPRPLPRRRRVRYYRSF